MSEKNGLNNNIERKKKGIFWSTHFNGYMFKPLSRPGV